jgi:Xaa-Pro aminopeptidase
VSSIGVDWQQRVNWDELRSARIDRMRAAMQRAGIGGVLVQRFENLKYLTSARPFTSLVYAPRYAAFLPAEGDVCLLTEGGDYALYQRDMPWISDLRVWPYDLSEASKVVGALIREHELAEARIAYDDAVSPSLVDRLRSTFPSVEFADGADVIGEAKAVKHPEEVKVLRRALEIAEIGMATALATIREGVRECEVAGEATRAMFAAGADALISYPQISTDPLRRMASDKQIRYGELVLVDFNIGFSGYIGDFARCVAVGKPTPEQRHAYRAQRECVETAIEHSRAGGSARTLQDAVAKVAESAGLAEYWQMRLTGHGLGTGFAPYEQPIIAGEMGFMDELQAGMVIAFEPGFFAPGLGPVRTEDVVLVTEGEAELLTHAPYDERLLEG